MGRRRHGRLSVKEPDVERALQELAAVPPREFTKERNALAARLAQAGDRAAAARVKALRAAPVAAWAVNRLATSHPDLVDRLVEAAEQVGTAQLGKDRTMPLGAAMTAYRGATDALLAGLDTQLAAGGVKASAPLRRRVESTLMAAAADPKTRGALRSGRLEEELAPAGFDLFSGATPAPRDETATEASSTVRERGIRPRAGADRPDRRRAQQEPHRPAAGERQAAAREARERERVEAKAAAAREKAAAAERLAPFAEAVAEAGRALADARRVLAGAREEERRANAAVAAATQRRRAAERALAAAKRRG